MWQFLSDPNVQRSLAFYGGGLATAVGALWVAWTKLRAKPPSPPSPAVQAERAIAAGGNIQAGGNVTNNATPTFAWIVLGLGLLVLGAVALFGRGDCVASVEGTGIAACRNVTGVVVKG